jgi:two-component system response regulator LytT
MKVVIIEDEPLLADDLQYYLRFSYLPCEVIAVISSVKEGLIFFAGNNDYQVVFSDIQLGDGLSFDIFKQAEIKTPVIFCTAYNQYAIEAFKNNGIDYLLKPFGQDAVNAALQRYDQLKVNMQQSTTSYHNILQPVTQLLSNPAPAASVLVSHRDKIIPIRHEDIALFFIRHGLVHSMDFEMKTFFVNHTLDELEDIAGKSFYRADRQHLVNRKAIKDVSQFVSRKLKLNLRINYTGLIAIRKEKTSGFLEWLSQ